MDLDELARRIVRRFGPEAAQWCARLPGLVDELAREWSLTPETPFPGGNSAVTIPCGRSVLKVSPDHRTIAGQVCVLERFAPSGRVVRVMRADPGRGAMLLEKIDPGTSCVGDGPSPAEFGALLRDLHAVTPPPPGTLGPLQESLAGFFPRFRARLTGDRPVTAADLDAAHARCAELAATADRTVLLHGDLHLDNLLHGPADRPYVVIDPVASLGDPAFDTVDYVLDAAGHSSIAARADAVAESAHLDPARVTAWSHAIAPLIALVPSRTPAQVDALMSWFRG